MKRGATPAARSRMGADVEQSEVIADPAIRSPIARISRSMPGDDGKCRAG